jgi:two-component system, response regulator PdtaR
VRHDDGLAAPDRPVRAASGGTRTARTRLNMPRRVVIAEDEAIIRLDLKEILQDEGYDVVGETGRGDEVVDLVRTHEPDLAILDVKMPGWDGLEAARAVRELGMHVAVLILTAFSQRNLIDEARDAGVIAYLVKPFQRIELIPAIEQAVARSEQEWAIDAEVREVAAERDGSSVPSAEDKIETRRLVDGAKELLMERAGLSEPEAFNFIQKTAMGTRTRMSEVAQQVLDGTLEP